MSIDTLRISKELEAAGEDTKVAEAHASILKSVVDDNLVTKDYLDLKIKELKIDITGEIKDLREELIQGINKNGRTINQSIIDMVNELNVSEMATQKHITHIQTLLYIVTSICVGSLPALVQFYS